MSRRYAAVSPGSGWLWTQADVFRQKRRRASCAVRRAAFSAVRIGIRQCANLSGFVLQRQNQYYLFSFFNSVRENNVQRCAAIARSTVPRTVSRLCEEPPSQARTGCDADKKKEVVQSQDRQHFRCSSRMRGMRCLRNTLSANIRPREDNIIRDSTTAFVLEFKRSTASGRVHRVG